MELSDKELSRENLAFQVFEALCDHLNYCQYKEELPSLLQKEYYWIHFSSPFRSGLKCWVEELAKGKMPHDLKFQNRWDSALKLSPASRKLAVMFDSMCLFIENEIKNALFLKSILRDKYSRELLYDYFYLGLECMDKEVYNSAI